LEKSVAYAIRRLFLIAGAVLISSDLSADNAHISDVNTDKAMYAPGDAVTIYADLVNSTSTGFQNGSVDLKISHLGHVSAVLPSQTVHSIGAGQSTAKIFMWLPPSVDYRGYMVEAVLRNSAGNIIDRRCSAIDVSSDWKRFPRYGYVSEYGSSIDAWNRIWQLKNYHINVLQFYDWKWKHHIPAPPSNWNSWPDVLNRTNYRSAVTGLIAAAHSYNMKALSYNDWGAAYDNCHTDGSGVTLSMGRFWGAPASESNQYTWGLGSWAATPQLRLMNNRDTAWQTYIFSRMQDVYSQFGFDGWHMDSLITNWHAYDYVGNGFNVYEQNVGFVNNAKSVLGRPVVINQIDGAGLEWIAKSGNTDFLYVELWSNYSKYSDLNRLFDEARAYTSRPVVYAAYVNYDKTGGVFNEPGVRLANAAIFACGAQNIALGDGGQMLHREYFPDTGVRMTDSLRSAMRSYYDFLTGYQNLLRDETVSAANSVKASISGKAVSTDAAANTIWTVAKKKPCYNIVHFLNLLNNSSAQIDWLDAAGTYPVPTVQLNLPVKMYHTGTVGNGRLFYASPDSGGGAATELTYTSGSDAGGSYVSFDLPRLEYWSMVWLEIGGAVRADTVIQAEHSDSYSAVGTETCHDSGGGRNVGFVNNLSGDSWLGFGRIDFGSGVTAVSARAASDLAGGTLEFRLDSPTGSLIGTVSVGNTGGWQNWQTRTAPASNAAGIRDLYVVFKNAATNLNWLTFSLVPDVPPAAPTGQTLLLQDAAIRLHSNDNSQPYLSGYSVYRSDLNPGNDQLVASNVSGSYYSDTNIISGCRYYYVVKAVSHAGRESPPSNAVTAILFGGDLTLDGKVDMEDAAKLAAAWLIGYSMDTLEKIAEDWLMDDALQAGYDCWE
jgi:dextranase